MLKPISFIFSVSLLLLISCTKENQVVDDEVQSVEDNIISEQEFMRIVPATNDRAIKQKGIGSSGNKEMQGNVNAIFRARDVNNASNAFLGWDEVNNSNFSSWVTPGDNFFKSNVDSAKIIINFGNTPTTDIDGNVKSGKITTILARDKSNPNKRFYLFGANEAEFKTIVKDFKVNDNTYNAVIETKRSSKTVMKVKILGGKTRVNGASSDIEYNNETERKITWLKGANHPNDSASNGIKYEYDEYSIEDETNGKCKGKTRNGLNYEMRIVKPLVYRTNAKYGIVDGEVELTPDGKKTRLVNYSKIADGYVIVTIDGNKFTVALKK
jgi:hypothetical protein